MNEWIHRPEGSDYWRPFPYDAVVEFETARGQRARNTVGNLNWHRMDETRSTIVAVRLLDD